MNKEILLSLIAISTVVALVSGATFAFFSDTETSSGNTFSAGTLDLKIRDQDEDWGDGVTATWTATDMKPGDEWDFRIPLVQLQESWDSTVMGNHTEITCDYSVIEEEPCVEPDTDCQTNEHPDEMAKEMLITRCIYKGTFGCINCLTGEKWSSYNSGEHTCVGTLLGRSNDWKIEDQNGDGKISFYDLKNDELDNLPPAPNVGMYDYEMGVKFSEDAGNDFQGDTFNLTMIFTLNQDSSQ